MSDMRVWMSEMGPARRYSSGMAMSWNVARVLRVLRCVYRADVASVRMSEVRSVGLMFSSAMSARVSSGGMSENP